MCKYGTKATEGGKKVKDSEAFDSGEERKIFRTFIVSLISSILLCFFGVFLGIAIRSNALIRETLLAQARSQLNGIVLTRQWNADYGGVFAEKKPGTESNRFLHDPDITTIDGRIYTKKNPALMTREISIYAERDGLFKFHMTGLHPLNPENEPDEYERRSLASFGQGALETHTTEKLKGGSVFRYMAPLEAEESCLQCHAEQGYKVGDILGGISVSFSVSKIERAMRINLIVILVLALVIGASLLAIILYFFNILRRKLIRIQEELRKAAITDALTNLHNRRYVLSRFEEEFVKAKRLDGQLCCSILDIDDFKTINDSYGHLVGDAVIREIGNILRESIRLYDVTGRYGGEEFIILFPGIGIENAFVICDRIRMQIEKRVAQAVPEIHFGTSVTVSFGISANMHSDARIEDMLQRADEALYAAKSSGKNRCGIR